MCDMANLNGLFAATVVAGVMSVIAPAQSAETYPSKPVRIVCPFPPGGGADSVARLLAEKFSERAGKPVIVDNRPGAGGNIGAGIVAKAAPDGYTLLQGSSSVLATGPALKRETYKTIAASYTPVLLISSIAYVLVVHPSIQAKSVTEFVQLARAQPGRINYASSGIGTASHLAMELFDDMARVSLVHVPFKGSSLAVITLIGGQVQAGFNNLVPALPHIKSGRLRALGVSGPSRWSGLPEVPTIAESGLPGYEALQWYGVMLPPGASSAIVDHLNREFGAILRMPEVREHLMSEGGEVAGGTTQEFAAYMRKEIEKWGRVVQTANIRAD
jgi:tripartite-type tricarboxylate transporter receptor subunit TctC